MRKNWRRQAMDFNSFLFCGVLIMFGLNLMNGGLR